MTRPSYRFAPGTVLSDEVPTGFAALRRTVDVGSASDLERLGRAVLDWAV